MDGAGNDWCIEDEETYEFKDCDGDGIPDPTCTAETSFGVIQSSNACKHKWTPGKGGCIEGNLLTYVETLCSNIFICFLLHVKHVMNIKII